MSFALDDTNDDDTSKTTDGNASQASDSGVSLGGGGANSAGPTSGNAAASNPQSQTQQPSKSGSWTNLQSYLSANQDQGAQVGNQIAGTINSQAETAQKDVNDTANAWNQNVAANTVQSNPDAVKKSIQDAQGLSVGQSLDPNDLSAYQTQANASYNGPTDFTKASGYGQAQQDLDTANTSLGETGSESGRDVLLQNQYQNASQNGYNQGQKNLDQLILQDSPGGQAALTPLQNQWSGLNTILGDTTTQANQTAQNAVTTNAATAQAAQKELNTANTDFQTGLNNKLTQAQTNNPASYANASSQVTPTGVSWNLASQLGLNPTENIFNVNPVAGGYLTQSPTATIANVATADDYARAQALAQLAGQTDNPFLSSTTASQAGLGDQGYNFNTGKFQNDVAAAQNAYQKAYTPLANNLASLQSKVVDLTNYMAMAHEGNPDVVNEANAAIQAAGGVAGQQALQAQIQQAQDAINQLNQQYQPGTKLSPQQVRR